MTNMIINGNLDLSKTNIESLGELKEVKKELFLNSCVRLTSLGNLEVVKYFLSLENCISLESLGNLRYLKRFNFKNCSRLKDLGNLIKLEDEDVYQYDFSSLISLTFFKIKESKASIDFSNCFKLPSLFDLTKIDGDIDLTGCKSLKDLGKLRNIRGEIIIDNKTGLTKEYIKTLNSKIRNKIKNIDTYYGNLFK